MTLLTSVRQATFKKGSAKYEKERRGLLFLDSFFLNNSIPFDSFGAGRLVWSGGSLLAWYQSRPISTAIYGIFV